VTEQTYKTDANAARAEFSSLVNTVQVRFTGVSMDKSHLADRRKHFRVLAGSGNDICTLLIFLAYSSTSLVALLAVFPG